jgi:hypothetical protein
VNKADPKIYGLVEVKTPTHFTDEIASDYAGKGLSFSTVQLPSDLTPGAFKAGSGARIQPQRNKEEQIRNIPGLRRFEIRGTDVRTGATRTFVIDTDRFITRPIGPSQAGERFTQLVPLHSDYDSLVVSG